MKYIIGFVVFWSMIVLANIANSHEFTPTYPKLKRSYVDGVMVTQMRLFNKRSDVEFYEISVYDVEWNRLPFASESRIIKVGYLKTKFFDIYIRESDMEMAEYICTQSKLKKEDVQSTGISSRICSRIK